MSKVQKSKKDKTPIITDHKTSATVRSLIKMSVCALSVLAVSGGCKLASSEKKNEVYAASESDTSSSQYDSGIDSSVPSGIAGVVSGVNATPSAGTVVNRIGISCDDVLVGQRVSKVSDVADNLNVSESMENTVDTLDAKVSSSSTSAKIMSDEDYENLLQIVEAEAGTEDLKGRILVANVIMNRVKYSEFPDTVTEVIYQYNDGVAQFSPVSDGRISEVTPSDETKEAVKQVLEGVDYSKGALFFIQRSVASKDNVAWFDKSLKKLFQHGVHEFYTYPTETDS